MKSGVTLQQMLTEVKRQSESKEDYLIAPNRLRMESYGKEMFLHLSDDSGTELIEPMTITGIAHRQIGTHLRIPAAYYDRMREERPDLLAYNANTWFKQESSQRMLRTLDGSARAYLSNRYRRIDNIDIAGVTLPILGGLPDIRFESCQITESRMYIKAVNPRLQAEVSPGDIVQAGVIISNSEVGLGSVSIQPLIYRLGGRHRKVGTGYWQQRHGRERGSRPPQPCGARYRQRRELQRLLPSNLGRGGQSLCYENSGHRARRCGRSAVRAGRRQDAGGKSRADGHP